MLAKATKFLLWIGLSLGLAYGPFWFQRKFLFGLHIPLCLLAVLSYEAGLAKIKRPLYRHVLMAVSLVMALPILVSSQLFQLAIQRQAASQNQKGAYTLSHDLMEALTYLKEHTSPDEIVFATQETSLLIPALSGNTTIWGHWAMSVDQEERLEWFKNIFGQNSEWDQERKFQEFWKVGITTIFCDAPLVQLLQKTNTSWLFDRCEKVFEKGSVAILKRKS